MEGFVAVTTVREEGSAEVLRAALEERGFPVEVKQLVPTAYLGAPTRIEYEVRVRAEHVENAEAVIGELCVESQVALDSTVPPAPTVDEEEAATALREAPPPARSKSLALGVAFAILVPVLGPIYAGAPGYALASLLVHVPLFFLLVGRAPLDPRVALSFWLLGRVLDLLGTQQFIKRHNAALAAANRPATEEDEAEHAAPVP